MKEWKEESEDADKYDKPLFELFGYLENEKDLKRTLQSLCKRKILEQEGSGAKAKYRINEAFGFHLQKIRHRNIIGRCSEYNMRLWSKNITTYGFNLHGYEIDDKIREEYTTIENDLKSIIKRISGLWYKVAQKDIKTMGIIKLVKKPKILIVLDVPIHDKQFQKLKSSLVEKAVKSIKGEPSSH